MGSGCGVTLPSPVSSEKNDNGWFARQLAEPLPMLKS
jgi:hypothetical protein